MSGPVICGAESTIVHVALARPIVGALICVGLGVGGMYSLTGSPDRFGGCGEPGGDLYQVTEVVEGSEYVCAVPVESPVALEK